MLAGGEALDGHSQIGAEGSLGGIEAGEKVTLDGSGEEALGKVLGVFVVLAKLEADESIDRLPIKGDDLLQRFIRQTGAHGFEEREPGGRKAVVTAADGGVVVQTETPIP
jgi:hypothetical protein